jgi:hypothetical protein
MQAVGVGVGLGDDAVDRRRNARILRAQSHQAAAEGLLVVMTRADAVGVGGGRPESTARAAAMSSSSSVRGETGTACSW